MRGVPALLVERPALADAEAVLLVDDRDREPGEADGRLDQRMGADDQRQLAALEPAEDLAAAGRRRRAGQQADRRRRPREQSLERGEVLLREGLGRRHQRRLATGLERAQHRVERDHGLPGPDLAHQQPLHRLRRRKVGVDLGERPALIGGRSERQAIDPVRDLLPRLAEPGRGTAAATLATAELERGLMQEELLVGEAGPRRAEILPAAREVHRDPSIGGTGEAVARAQRSRQRLDHGRSERQRRPDPLADPLHAKALAAGMDRDDPGRVKARRRPGPVADRIGAALPRSPGADDLVGVGAKAAAVGAATEQQPDPGLEPVGEPRLVEPGDRDRAGTVEDGGFDDPQVAAPGRPQARRPDLGQHRRGPARDQLADRGDDRPVDPVVGVMLDQVAVRDEADPGRGGGNLLADAPEVGQRPGDARAQRADAVGRCEQTLAIGGPAAEGRGRLRRTGAGGRNGGRSCCAHRDLTPARIGAERHGTAGA